jgi:ABC-type lipoprotein export system ATPase subunit|tara:strand:+ start:193 stop:894 length:702 start_codon:yes stop_codon:yes gene_type:complete
MSSFTNSTPDREKSPYALEVLGVSKSFGSVDVLKKVELKLKVGERVALMGPSGSGKSTLLNCICGIEPVDSGEIKVGGKSLSQLDGANLELLRRESIGYVFQSFHLLPTLSAFENIEFPGQLVGMPKKERLDRVAQLLESVGLSHRSEHLPDALSGGECQRVAIARALMHFPRLLLADEPTGSLDTSSGDQILELLEELSQEHSVALLLVTHDHTSTRICDRVISMRDGSLSQ